MELRFKNVDSLDEWMELNLAHFKTVYEAAGWLNQLTRENKIILVDQEMKLDELARIALAHFRS